MAAVLVASFGAFLALTDKTVVNVAFPNLEAAFPHATVGDLSWILNSYSIAFAGMLVVGGRFADLVSGRRIFKTGLVLFTVASGLCAAANSVEILIAFRALQGAGAAMLAGDAWTTTPNEAASISAATDPEGDRTRRPR